MQRAACIIRQNRTQLNPMMEVIDKLQHDIIFAN